MTKNPSRPKLRNQLLFVLGILVLAAGAFYTALVVATQIDQIFFPGNEIKLGSALSHLPGVDKGNTSEDIGGGRINILVMGMDRRPTDGSQPTRTDTMFVLSIDPATHTARGLGIPRDLWVDIPSKSGNSSFQQRINTAYEYGELQGYSSGGAGLVKQVVGNLLGIKINYYVLIDFEGFREIINLLGGVDVEVTPDLTVNDPYYSETERLGDYYPCIFPAGTYHMNGSQALCYARVRNGSSDFERILRQQLVMYAVMKKAGDLNVLANAESLWKRYKNTVTTDINDFQLPGFARLASGIDQQQVSFLTLAPVTTPYTTQDGAAVLLYSKEGIKEITSALVGDERLLKESASVEVQNGTGEQGQAQKAVDYLKELGMPEKSLTATNASDPGHARTEIIDYNGKSYTAKLIARWLGVPQDRVRESTQADAGLRSSEADIVVILGPDAKLASAVAQPSP